MLPDIHSLKCKKEAYLVMVIGHILLETVKHIVLKVFVIYAIYMHYIYDIDNVCIYIYFFLQKKLSFTRLLDSLNLT